MAANPEVNPLKDRRKTAQAAVTESARTDVPPLADRPVLVGEDISRRFPLLGDPREPRMVAESGGALFGVQPGEEIDGYVIAPTDAYETIVPPGCKTGTSRLRWAAGHHVPTEVYREWQANQTSDAVKVLDALSRSGAAD